MKVMRVKHLRGWVDKRRTASRKLFDQSVEGSVSFSGFVIDEYLKLHLDNCTENDSKKGQLLTE